MANVDYTEFDQEIWDRELEDFVPPVVYDMHTHIWSEAHRRDDEKVKPGGLRLEIDYQDHLDWAAKLYPGREMHYLVLGTPVLGLDLEAHNDWMAAELKADSKSRGHMLVTPNESPDYVSEQVRKHNFLGLKCYRTFAPDRTHCRIRDFLPEALIEVANDLGLSVTLHMSKPTGPADPDNQRDLKRYTKEYPNVQWILAHCARGFNAFFLEESIEFYKDLPNIWYDTSAVNDIVSHFLLMKHEDRNRVMFGSDNIVAGCVRGKYITYGKAWEYFKGFPELEHCDPTATFVIYEQLRQERHVADMLGLTQQEIEDHFSGNAIRFLETVERLRGSK